MTEYQQLDVFATHPAPARGPIQSQQTLDSLGHDGSLKRLIAKAVFHGSHSSNGQHDRPVTDDDILWAVEIYSSRRQQRNVIARTRGLMEAAGWFVQVPDVVGRTGRRTRAVIPAPSLLNLMRSDGSKSFDS